MATNFKGFLFLSGSARDNIGDSSTYSGNFGISLSATLDSSGTGSATETVGGNGSVMSYTYNYTPSGYGTGSGTIPFSFSTPTLQFQQGTFHSTLFKIPVKNGNSYFYATLSGSITNQGLISEQLVGTISGINHENHPFTGTLGGNTTLACFVEGTRILTVRGEVAVEQLAVGQLVVTGVGRRLAPVVWIGHRRVWDTMPVRVRAGAFGVGCPCADVRLSPDHAVYCAGVLIPVRYLVNGESVVWEALQSVTYWHVELDRHDVMLAEGLLVESFLDTGNRGVFSGEIAAPAEFAFQRWEAAGCAPLLLGGSLLETIRARLRPGALSSLGLGHDEGDAAEYGDGGEGEAGGEGFVEEDYAGEGNEDGDAKLDRGGLCRTQAA